MCSQSSKIPLVSVIVPTYNSAHYLNEALESIRAQTFRSFEIIVVDDGSTDETASVAQSSGEVRYFRQEQAGSGSARNRGVEQARGEFVAFLDADDLWSPEKLSLQMASWNSLPPTDAKTVIFAHALQFFSPELDEKSRSVIHLPNSPQAAHLPGNLFTSRADFLAIGPYIEGLGQSLDWLLRARDGGARIQVLPEVTLFRRIHSTNTSRTQTQEKKLYVRSLKESLDRRRQKSKEQ